MDISSFCDCFHFVEDEIAEDAPYKRNELPVLGEPKQSGLWGMFEKPDIKKEEREEFDNALVPYVVIVAYFVAYFHLFENASLLDAAYFCFVSFSTIGFGDILPGGVASRRVAMILSFFGIGFHAQLIQSIGNRTSGILSLFSNFLLCLVVGTLIFCEVEGWSMEESLYFNFIMGTTIGYGGYTPKTEKGKIFIMIFHFWSLWVFGSMSTEITRIISNVFKSESNRSKREA